MPDDDVDGDDELPYDISISGEAAISNAADVGSACVDVKGHIFENKLHHAPWQILASNAPGL